MRQQTAHLAAVGHKRRATNLFSFLQSHSRKIPVIQVQRKLPLAIDLVCIGNVWLRETVQAVYVEIELDTCMVGKIVEQESLLIPFLGCAELLVLTVLVDAFRVDEVREDVRMKVARTTTVLLLLALLAFATVVVVFVVVVGANAIAGRVLGGVGVGGALRRRGRTA
jgi:hypothetical protein